MTFFIKLTDNSVLDTRRGTPIYVESRFISRIVDNFKVGGYKDGSHVYLKDGSDIIVMESPESIIAMINDGDFCMYSAYDGDKI